MRTRVNMMVEHLDCGKRASAAPAALQAIGRKTGKAHIQSWSYKLGQSSQHVFQHKAPRVPRHDTRRRLCGHRTNIEDQRAQEQSGKSVSHQSEDHQQRVVFEQTATLVQERGLENGNTVQTRAVNETMSDETKTLSS